MTVVGIDPGKSGGISVVSVESGELLSAHSMPKDEFDAAQLIYTLCKEAEFAAIERVTGWMPRTAYIPMSRMFTMGWWTGGPVFAASLALPKNRIKLVMAHKWQRDLNVLSKGDKKALANHAHLLFNKRIKQQCADSALIAGWAQIFFKNFYLQRGTT